MGRREIEAFLTHLAVDQNVAASTQNQAFSALFLYRYVLEKELQGSIDAMRAIGQHPLGKAQTLAHRNDQTRGVPGHYFYRAHTN